METARKGRSFSARVQSRWRKCWRSATVKAAANTNCVRGPSRPGVCVSDWEGLGPLSNLAGLSPRSWTFTSGHGRERKANTGWAGAFARLETPELVVGHNGSGRFLQTSGHCDVSEFLRIGRGITGSGEYTIQGGALDAGSLQIGFGGQGSFEVAGNAPTVILDEFEMYESGSLVTRLTAGGLSMIHVDEGAILGGTWSILRRRRRRLWAIRGNESSLVRRFIPLRRTPGRSMAVGYRRHDAVCRICPGAFADRRHSCRSRRNGGMQEKMSDRLGTPAT